MKGPREAALSIIAAGFAQPRNENSIGFQPPPLW
jgi:hypothetical protein